jgi:hypothetical protein
VEVSPGSRWPRKCYITQYIISGIGKLLKLKAIPAELQAAFRKMIVDGIVFLDKEIKSDYEMQLRGPAQPLNPIRSVFIYAQLFSGNNCSRQCFRCFESFRNLSIEKWTEEPFTWGLIALFLNRSGESKIATDILATLKENSVYSGDLACIGCVKNGYYWQEAPLETQSLLIETFQELHADQNSIDQMKFWLLNKNVPTLLQQKRLLMLYTPVDGKIGSHHNKQFRSWEL